jgi:hypothetical protein
MTDFYKYEDTQLRMQLPIYLRPPKKGYRFFKVDARQHKKSEIDCIAVSFRTKEGAERDRNRLNTRMEPTNQMGVHSEVVRQGASLFVLGGTEAFVRSRNSRSEDILFQYGLIFEIDGQYLYVAISGKRNFKQFEDECQKIVTSIKLKGVGAGYDIKQKRSTNGRLTRADQSKLNAALGGLPSPISYLRRSISAIAKQNQDLLGSGEADFGPIEKALLKNAKPGAIGSVSDAHADILRKWLTTFSDHSEPWAGPAWFVEGFLRGYRLWGSDAGK